MKWLPTFNGKLQTQTFYEKGKAIQDKTLRGSAKEDIIGWYLSKVYTDFDKYRTYNLRDRRIVCDTVCEPYLDKIVAAPICKESLAITDNIRADSTYARRRYKITPSPIGWAQASNQPCNKCPWLSLSCWSNQ